MKELQNFWILFRLWFSDPTFEKAMVNDAIKGGEKVAEQVTVKANNGVKTRIDAVSKTQDGTIKLREAKASSTAPLTKNQKAAHPSIQQSGGVVVGKGKPGFPGGTKIPPTKVEIVRTKNQTNKIKLCL